MRTVYLRGALTFAKHSKTSTPSITQVYTASVKPLHQPNTNLIHQSCYRYFFHSIVKSPPAMHSDISTPHPPQPLLGRHRSIGTIHTLQPSCLPDSLRSSTSSSLRDSIPHRSRSRDAPALRGTTSRALRRCDADARVCYVLDGELEVFAFFSHSRLTQRRPVKPSNLINLTSARAPSLHRR